MLTDWKLQMLFRAQYTITQARGEIFLEYSNSFTMVVWNRLLFSRKYSRSESSWSMSGISVTPVWMCVWCQCFILIPFVWLEEARSEVPVSSLFQTFKSNQRNSNSTNSRDQSIKICSKLINERWGATIFDFDISDDTSRWRLGRVMKF